MSESAILVTTIIPTHNRAPLLREAIASALSQDISGSDHQIIVVDDNSTDDTSRAVAAYPNVKYIKVSCGNPSCTRNAGLRIAKGRYIAFLDDDDVWLPNRFSASLAVLDANPDVGMVYCQAALATHDLKVRSTVWPPAPLGQGHPVTEFLTNVVSIGAVLIRRSILDSVGLFNEQVSSAEDMDFAIRIARKYRVIGIPKVVALTRLRDSTMRENVDDAAAKWNQRAKDDLGLIALHCSVDDSYKPAPHTASSLMSKRKGWYASMMLATAKTAMSQGNSVEARACAKAALTLSPLHVLRSPSFYRAMLLR